MNRPPHTKTVGMPLRHGRRWAIGLLVVAVVTMVASLTRAADEAKIPAREIAAAQARQHLNQRVTVQFKVLHAKAASGPDRVYLDSEKDYKDPRNLGILIEAAALPSFRKAGIEKPADHYDGKTIRLTGKPYLRDGLVFISAARPEEIEIVKQKDVEPKDR